MRQARVHVVSPVLARLLVEAPGGRWRDVLLVHGVDAEGRAGLLRPLLELEVLAPGDVALADPAGRTDLVDEDAGVQLVAAVEAAGRRA